MKISQLPEHVKIKALKYQKNAGIGWGKKTDNLVDAFDWGLTKEGHEYWSEWSKEDFIEVIKKMYSEEEMFNFINEYFNDAVSGCNLRAKEWFNKFKK
jgi:hypothetical protein